jgi:Tachylectin
MPLSPDDAPHRSQSGADGDVYSEPMTHRPHPRRPASRSGAAPRGAVRGLTRAVAAAGAVGLAVLAGPPASAATVTCGTADGFTRLSGGALYRLQDPTPLAGVNSLTETGLIGSGWGSFAWTGSGGDGVLYALTSAGRLLWYRYDASTSAWAKGSGGLIGAGFTPGSKVINIAVGADGWIYTVRADGRLALYQHTGRLTGAATWANSGGYVMGAGWSGNELIAPQGGGTIYTQVSGSLYWFKHSDPRAGTVTWANGGRGTKIGSGWRFYDLLALGGGVLLATASPSGEVTLYQHADPAGGGQGWAVAGLKKYQARSDSFGITMSPATCS